jgi:CheY-like chemotaxis protein
VHILLVEDSPRDAETALRTLHGAGAADQVHWVKDGEEALDYLFCSGPYAGRDSRDSPTLVLLDIKMPRIDGIEVLRRVKGSELRPIPVVVMATSTEERDVLESYRLGIAAYLVKPFEQEAFLDTVLRLRLTQKSPV